MSDIAKLLVETTARLRSGVCPGNLTTFPEPMWPFDDASAEARRIVAEFYGPPCDGKGGFRFADVVGLTSLSSMTVDGPEAESQSDVCLSCGWPRGEHGGKA